MEKCEARFLRESGFVCLSTLQVKRARPNFTTTACSCSLTVCVRDYCVFGVELKAEHLVHTPLITWQV